MWCCPGTGGGGEEGAGTAVWVCCPGTGGGWGCGERREGRREQQRRIREQCRGQQEGPDSVCRDVDGRKTTRAVVKASLRHVRLLRMHVRTRARA